MRRQSLLVLVVVLVTVAIAALTAIGLAGASGSAASRGVRANAAIPISARTLEQMKGEYGALTYVPGFAPRGFIFTSWRIEEPAFAYLMRRLQLTFGRNGTRLIWTVSDGRDTDDYADCSARPYYSLKRNIDGHVVYYARGNHGDSAWICMTARGAGGLNERIGVDLWIANEAGRPSRLTAMKVVASARRA
jgi:hypothetical protein